MKKITYLILFLLIGNLAAAHSLEGIVLDKSNTPIFDAYIFLSKGNDYTLSNEIGKFKINDVELNDTLNISFLGFKTLKYVITQDAFDREVEFVLEGESIDLEQVTITNSVKAVNTIAAIDLKVNPVNSSQEVLRKVPGLFIAQHAGGGKAEQIFLRGFDIDHGTDIAINVDGMPVNMVSHAHGQGYADLHFLIPETVENIDFAKGPYYADHGNFTTAGYVDFKTKDKLDQNIFGMEVGQFNTFRTVAALDLLEKKKGHNAYIASEFLLTDGPVESPQNFKRINLMGKYTMDLKNRDKLSVLFSHFQSKWDASGQIPQRLVDNGTITRFGSVDDTEGGNTSRTNLALSHTKIINDNSFLKSNFFYSNYDFELFSNFTFFLDDTINGDQIRQYEQRNIFGLNSTLFQNYTLGNTGLEMSYGVGLRYDDVNDNELSHTANRKTIIEQYALGDVDEANFYGFVNAEFDFGKWMINPSVRLDAFTFDYQDRLAPTYTSLSEQQAIVSPHLKIIYNPNPTWQLFLKGGKGFHSNDTRVVVARDGKQILPAAYGADLGAVWKPLPRLWLNGALWHLYLEQEFVYVGDAGIVEPSGQTRRQGFEFGMRYQLGKYLFFNADINYTHARAIDEEDGANYIPLAPDLTSVGGLSFQHPNGFTGSLRYRYIKDRPANEDNSIVAEGYFVVDANLNYTFKRVTLGLSVENLLDTEWNEAQFATESRLRNETESVEEIHFTPGVPFFLKGTVKYTF
ncbi:MAG: TonB-dependent receptor [Saprospiraceae bacterium]